MWDREYTLYVFQVSTSELDWIVKRRFREFQQLHDKITAIQPYPFCYRSNGAKAPMPQLPARTYFSSKHNEHTIQQRKRELEDYIRELVILPGAETCIPLLSFLGLISTARERWGRDLGPTLKSGAIHGVKKGSENVEGVEREQADASTINKEGTWKARGRQVIHVSRVSAFAKVGDIILFHCNNQVSAAQRVVTSSEWDHVAIVGQRYPRGPLLMLECTGCGVTIFPLVSRLKGYLMEFAHHIAIRRIRFERSEARLAKMHAYLKRVEGGGYSLHPLKLLMTQKKSRPSQDNSPSSSSSSFSSSSPSSSISSSSTFSSESSSPGNLKFRNTTLQKVDDPREKDRPVLHHLDREVRQENQFLEQRRVERLEGTVRDSSSSNRRDSLVPTAAALTGTLMQFIGGEVKDNVYFCSELVAEALQEMEVLSDERGGGYYWPM